MRQASTESVRRWRATYPERYEQEKRAASEKTRLWRLANKVQWLANSREYLRKKRREGDSYGHRYSAFVGWLKQGPCLDCGKQFPPVAMDFDHVRGMKLRNIGIAQTLEQLQVEVAKCELVCAN